MSLTYLVLSINGAGSTNSKNNPEINSVDLARLLNIPVDQLNDLLAQQIQPFITPK
jgi:hypothetical protein